MQKVKARDLLNEQERRLQKMRQQERDNDIDWNAKSQFLEKPYYMTQTVGKNPARQQGVKN